MVHRFVLHNETIREAGEAFLKPGQVGLLSGWGVFTTLRIAGGVLFAWERHWARMRRDAAVLRVPFPPDADAVEHRLLELVRANQAHEAAMRVAILRNRGASWEGPGIERPWDLIALTADLTDWGEAVRLAVAPQARHATGRFAGTKVLSWGFNLALLEEAQSRGFDEVILLNERGEVSECTSANIFAIVGHRVWTPPLSSGCLPGITREILLQELRVPGVEIGERELYLQDLERADEVLITSTTRNLLPVSEIEGLPLPRRGTTGALLRRAFEAYVEEYVAKRRPASVLRRSP
ncbi:MAG: aminotransferase class IV [Bryobacterales bacterium]|nr:aminotransferase class IV [Bryobacteraceae bacterium]MDW8356169.1 aminotransferase class IV [Bryobacterales bacterium]